MNRSKTAPSSGSSTVISWPGHAAVGAGRVIGHQDLLWWYPEEGGDVTSHRGAHSPLMSGAGGGCRNTRSAGAGSGDDSALVDGHPDSPIEDERRDMDVGLGYQGRHLGVVVLPATVSSQRS